MKFILNIIFVLVLFSCNTQSQDLLSPEAFEKGMKNDSTHQLLDVRTPEEYDGRHLQGAINNNYNDEKFVEHLKHLDKDKAVYVYCLSGGRSAEAQKIMKEQGFKTVYNLEGGIRNWETNNKPIEHSKTSEAKKGLTVNDFNALLEGDKPVLIDFNAKWCPPCRRMAPYLEKLTAELAGDIKIIPIDVDANKEPANAYKIETLPTLLLFKNKEIIWQHSGYISEADLREIIKKHN